MTEPSLRNGLFRRVWVDACIGLAVFVVFAFGVTFDRTGGVGGFQSMAHLMSARASTHSAVDASTVETGPRSKLAVNQAGTLVGGPTTGDESVDMAFARTDQTTAIVLLAGIFSAVFAFNLAFYRRLRTVYASSRRRRIHGS